MKTNLYFILFLNFAFIYFIGLSIGLFFQIIFPHEHNYAEAIQNQFLSIIKWLKLVHTKTDPSPSKSRNVFSISDFFVNVIIAVMCI